MSSDCASNNKFCVSHFDEIVPVVLTRGLVRFPHIGHHVAAIIARPISSGDCHFEESTTAHTSKRFLVGQHHLSFRHSSHGHLR